jgi:hypothetical protein
MLKLVAGEDLSSASSNFADKCQDRSLVAGEHSKSEDLGWLTA